jgi:hypothetical protein
MLLICWVIQAFISLAILKKQTILLNLAKHSMKQGTIWFWTVRRNYSVRHQIVFGEAQIHLVYSIGRLMSDDAPVSGVGAGNGSGAGQAPAGGAGQGLRQQAGRRRAECPQGSSTRRFLDCVFIFLPQSLMLGDCVFVFSVADLDPGSGAFSTPESGIRDGKNLDLSLIVAVFLKFFKIYKNALFFDPYVCKVKILVL